MRNKINHPLLESINVEVEVDSFFGKPKVYVNDWKIEQVSQGSDLYHVKNGNGQIVNIEIANELFEEKPKVKVNGTSVRLPSTSSNWSRAFAYFPFIVGSFGIFSNLNIAESFGIFSNLKTFFVLIFTYPFAFLSIKALRFKPFSFLKLSTITICFFISLPVCLMVIFSFFGTVTLNINGIK